MKSLRANRLVTIFAILFVLSAGIAPVIRAAIAGAGTPLEETPIGHSTELMYSNISISVAFLLFLLWSLRRQTSVEDLNKRYDHQATVHLEAFKQINERNTTVLLELCADYRALTKETRDAIISGAVNTRELITELKHIFRQKES